MCSSTWGSRIREGGALLLAVLLPLAGLLAHGGLVGWSGVGRGEFESWAFFDWWLPKLTALRWSHGGLLAALRVPAHLDVGNVLDQWLITLPCKALLGPVAGHDARVAVVLALNAAAALFLTRAIGGDADEALALVLALNPVTLWDIAECRMAQALLAPTFLYLGLLLRWRCEPARAARVAALGGSLALVGLTYWYAAVFLLPLALWVGIRAPRWLAHLAVAAVLVLPFAWPYAARYAPYGAPFPPLASLSVPPRGALGPLGPGLTVSQSVDLADPLRPVDAPALPWVWPVLAVLAVIIGDTTLFRARRPGEGMGAEMGDTLPRFALGRGCLFACSAFWWVLALGPYLVWHGTARPVPMPFAAAYRFLPFWRRLYWPGRTLPYAFTAWVLVAAPLLRGRMRRWMVAAVVAVVAVAPGVAAGLLPLPCTAPHVPAFYRGLRGGLIEASFAWGSNQAGYYQSYHHQKVLGNQAHAQGFGDDPAVSADLMATSVARSVAAVRDGRADPAPGPWRRGDLAALRAAGYRWLIVQRRYGGRPVPTAAALAVRVSEGLGRAPDHQDPDLLSWRLQENRGENRGQSTE